MRSLLLTACAAVGFLGWAEAASAAGCGDVTIASMNWQSAEVLANVDRFILNKGFGCNADITTGDTVPTITSMVEKGQPDVAPEGWVDLLPEVANRGLSEGKIVKGATALPDGGIQGWWIPQYIADAHPDIKTIGDVLMHPDLFPAPEDRSKGAIMNGPQGWGGTVVTTQLYKAFDGDKHNFTLVDTGSAAGLDGSIAKAYERKRGWAGYYWSPTSLLGKYKMVKLDAGVPEDMAEWKRCNTVADCPNPKPNSWPVDHVYTLMSKKFADRAGPDVVGYLNTRAWSNDTVQKLMAWMTDNQATGEDGAKHFLKENEAIWTKWVAPPVAQKVKAAL